MATKLRCVCSSPSYRLALMTVSGDRDILGADCRQEKEKRGVSSCRSGSTAASTYARTRILVLLFNFRIYYCCTYEYYFLFSALVLPLSVLELAHACGVLRSAGVYYVEASRHAVLSV